MQQQVDPKQIRYRLPALGLLATAVFSADLALPLGIAGGLLYVSLLPAALGLPGQKPVVYAALAGTLLAVAGGLIAQWDNTLGTTLADRLPAVAAIWVAAAAAWRHKKAVTALRQQAHTLDLTHDAVVVTDPNGLITDWNPAAEALFGYTAQEALGRYISLVYPEDQKTSRPNPEAHEAEIRTRRKSGEDLHAHLRFLPLKNEAGRVTGMIAFFKDITEQKKAQNILVEQGMRDSLTHLYNRRYFDQRVREEFARADRHKQPLAFLLCDLDGFKAVNDTLGHQTGDKILQEVSKCIQDATRGADLVFRWGGDEVLVVLSNANRKGILVAADRIRKGILRVGERNAPGLDVGIGVALYPEHGTDTHRLVQMANRALYIAKKGGGKIHIGDEEYQLDENAVKVVFQPVINTQTDEVLGYEALSRDPQGKLPILELFKRYEAVGQLNELKTLCFKLQLRKAQELDLERVFINIDFHVLKQMDSAVKPPNMEVILEISENQALYDIQRSLEVIRKWRTMGFKFAIDDFGAGFISLPFVAQLIPDYIKIDRSTILEATSSEQFNHFLADLIQALRNYSKEGIIAEGVETEKEFQTVSNMGTYLIQGFLLGKPQELIKPHPDPRPRLPSFDKSPE